jgi:hypothetical protein
MVRKNSLIYIFLGKLSIQQEKKKQENEDFFRDSMENLSKSLTETLQGCYQMGRIINAVVRVGFKYEQIARAQSYRLSAKKIGRCREYFLYCTSLCNLLGKEIYPVFTFTEFVEFKNLPSIARMVTTSKLNLETLSLNVGVHFEINLLAKKFSGSNSGG